MRGDAAKRGQPLVRYWHSERPPDYLAGLLATFPEHNPAMRHLVFSERSAAAFIAEHFGARETAAFGACAVPAMQADYFRYCAIYALGGVYADVDFRCVAALSSLLDDRGGGTLFGRPELPPPWQGTDYEWRERVGPYRVVMNSIFALPRRHPLLALAIEVATANIEHRVGEDVALVTGPLVLTSLYLLRELGSFEAFLAYVQGGVLASAAPRICAAVEDFERVPVAFEGVTLRSVAESREFVRGPGFPLPYKQTEDHWMNVKSSIYRGLRNEDNLTGM